MCYEFLSGPSERQKLNKWTDIYENTIKRTCTSVLWSHISELSIILTSILTLHGLSTVLTPKYLLHLSSKLLFSFYFLLSDIWHSSHLLGTLAIFVIIWKLKNRILQYCAAVRCNQRSPNARQGIQQEKLTHGVTHYPEERLALAKTSSLTAVGQ